MKILFIQTLKVRRVAIETKEKRVYKHSKNKLHSLIVRFKKVDSFLNEKEKSIERQRRLAAKTADIIRTRR